MNPLGRAESFQEIRSIFSLCRNPTVIAPYFGKGALSALGIAGAETLTVVCDLLSGGCNPTEIEKIRNIDGAVVKTLRGLHAKIYMTEDSIIVGSANPSANGLGFENDEVLGNIEACLKIVDEQTCDFWRTFVTDEIIRKARVISDDDMRRASELWERRRRNRERAEYVSLWSTMKSDPNYLLDRRIFFWIYTGAPLSDEQAEILEEERNRLGDFSIDAYSDEIDPDVRAGDTVLDFCYEKTLKFQGIWTFSSSEPIVKKNAGIRPVSRAKSVNGMRFGNSDAKIACAVLRNLFPQAPDLDISKSAYDLALMLKGSVA